MRCGPYEVLAELGRGGMGAVFRARHVETGAEVALKVLLEGAVPDETARFLREGQAVARLRHPGVVTVHAAGVEAGRRWLAMELVQGESLRARLSREGPLEPGLARRLFARLADALEHAHAHGVLHRDLKPDNVIIDVLGEPRLIDFGLAHVGDRSRLTRTGDVLGTPAYMAPEQVAGARGAVGPRTDVYGLGATLFDALTGRPPFQGGPIAILQQVLKDPPPSPAALRPGLDRRLAALCLACLEKDPARRPASAAALARALRGLDRRRADRAARLRWAAPAALVVAVTGGLVAAVALRPRPGATPRAPAVAAMPSAAEPVRAPEAIPAPAPAPAAPAEAAATPADEVARLVARAHRRVAEQDLDGARDDLLAALSLDPRSADARVAHAALLDLRGDAAGARREVDQALEHAPGHFEALRLSAKLRFAAGDLQGALVLLDAALAQRPDHVESLANRASARAALRDDAGAVQDLQRVASLTGGLAFRELVTLAKALFRLERWQEADAAYAQARALDPRDDRTLSEELRVEAGQVGARARGELALEAIARAELARATALLGEAMELDPTYANAPYNRGQLLLQAGDARGALADFERALALEDDAAGRVGRAMALLLLGEGPRARDDLDVAVARGAAGFDVLEQRAIARWLCGDVAGARADLDAACREAPGHPGLLVMRAELRLSLGDADGAGRDAAAALALAPREPAALILRGRAHAAVGRPAQAAADHDEACRAAPGSPTAFWRRALLRRASDPRGAAEDLARAAALPAEAAHELLARAEARALRGDATGARADCDAVIARDGRLVEALLLRARLRRAAGDLDGARADAALGASRAPPGTDIGQALRQEQAALGPEAR